MMDLHGYFQIWYELKIFICSYLAITVAIECSHSDFTLMLTSS